jgi:N-acetylneuraminic acid mutarotase
MEMKTKRNIKLAAVRGLFILAGTLSQSALGQPVGTWTVGPSMPAPSYALGAKFVNGKFYAISGFRFGGDPSLRIYNPATGQWSSGANLPADSGFNLRQFFGCAVANGKIYVIGGDTGGSGSRNTNYEYDTANNTWAIKAVLPGGPRWNLAAATLNGKIYVIGGQADGAPVQYFSRVDIYDPSTDTWSSGTPLPAPRVGMAVEAINNKIYLAGGFNGTNTLSDALAFDPNNPGSWTPITSTPIAGAYLGQSTVLGGKFFIIGCGPSPSSDNAVQAYDLVSNSWSTNYSLLPTAREDGGAAGDDASGKIYYAGGYNNGFIGELDILSIAPTPTPTPSPATLGNISTRLRVGTGDNAMIGGFIIAGIQPKTVIVRGIGPSLPIPGALADPVIEVHGSSGELLATNDNWNDAATRQEIIDSGLAPTNDLESALWGILNPGAYTVVVRGTNGGTGIGLFEVYDLDRTVDSRLANISTRGFVQSGDNAMIGGFIVVTQATRVIIRAIGPSLTPFGVPDALANPQLELHDATSLIGRNDDWQTTQLGGIITSDQVAEIQNSQLAPTNAAESAIIATLAPGSYTAIVRGVNNTTGNALVEVYALP